MAGDNFTRQLFTWLNRVAADPEITALGFKLAFVIGQHLNGRPAMHGRQRHCRWRGRKRPRGAKVTH